MSQGLFPSITDSALGLIVFLQAVKFDQTLPISQARKDADSQLAVRIQDPGLRAWLLMNMKQDPVTKKIDWKINLAGIHSAFYKDIARFPSVSGTFNKWVANTKIFPFSNH